MDHKEDTSQISTPDALNELHEIIHQYGNESYKILNTEYDHESIKDIARKFVAAERSNSLDSFKALKEELGSKYFYAAAAQKSLGETINHLPPTGSNDLLVSVDFMARVAINLFQAGMALVEAGAKSMEPYALMGKSLSKTQAARAQKPRKGERNDALIRLVRTNPGLTNKELWPKFYSNLEDLYENVKEAGNRKQPKTWEYIYVENGSNKTISYRTFCNLISKIKKASR